MPRPPRLEIAGGLHHVTTRAPKGLLLFRDLEEPVIYLQHLAGEVRERGWSLLTFCLMPNHVHLLVRTPEPDLGLGLKAVHERFVRRVHARHAGHGHLFGGPFKNKPVVTAGHALACLRYIARNPVKAGLCDAPQDWPWSAHRALAGLDPAPRFLDVTAVQEIIGRDAYVEWANTPDLRLLDELAARPSDAWMPRAVDEHQMSVQQIATHLGISPSTAYRRLAAARENEGSDP